MLLVMVVDLAITLLGQPDSYWTDPRTAAEGNVVVRFFMHQGLALFALACIAYGPLAVFLVSALPRRIGLFLLLTLTLWHYHGASTWLGGHFDTRASVWLYGIVLAATLVCLGLGDGSGGFPAIHWRRFTRIFATAMIALLMLGGGAHLWQVRATRLAKQRSYPNLQRVVDEAKFVGQYRAADASFAMLFAPKEGGMPDTVQEAEFLKFVRAASPADRKVFILYDVSAFPLPALQKAFEQRMRSIMASAGAKINFLLVSTGK